MDKKQFDALVNKGAITHVGIAADIEKLSDKEICDRYVTKHEVATEVLSGEDEQPEVPEVPEVPTKPTVKVLMTTEGTPKVGEIVTTKVGLESAEYEGTNVRVRVTINPANATKAKYKEGDQWLDLPVDGEDGVYYFGASAGFPLTNGAETEFHNECLVAGDVTTKLEIIEVATGEVIGEDSITVTIAKAAKKSSKKAEAAPVVDPVTPEE